MVVFYNQTLLKDGAFMVCESASEYDENVPAPDHDEEIKVQLVKEQEEHAYDPVMKLFYKMRPYYERLKELSNTEVPADETIMVSTVEEISTFASDLFDKLRMCEVKLSAMHHAVNHDRFIFEPVLNNLGMLVQNKSDLVQAGCYEVTINSTIMKCLYAYHIAKLAAIIESYVYGYKKVTIDINTLKSVTRYDDDELFNSFNSIVDIFDFLFDDSKRIRRERTNTRSVPISELIDGCYEVERDEILHDRPDFCKADKNVKHYLINFASKQLRAIKVSLGDFVINAPEYTASDQLRVKFVDVTRDALVAMFDVFYLFMFDLSYKAYSVHERMAIRDGYNSFVNQVKETLKHQ